MRFWIGLALAALAAAATDNAVGKGVPNRLPPPFGVDAPELAAPGPYPVGVRTARFVQKNQADPEGGAPADRRLEARVWYPATAQGRPILYRSALPARDGHDVAFTIQGRASEGAAPAKGSFPLVILAHGYSNTPEALAWLGENLASKGYVVVAPAFRDPPIGDPSKTGVPFARRPLDIAFVTAESQARARAHAGPLVAADPERTVLIGYSMGGYGVLTAAGAPLDPGVARLTHGVMTPFVDGGPDMAALKVAHLKAVVAMSPASRLGGHEMWSAKGVSKITAPTLFIVGDQDRTVGYDPGVRTLFQDETAATRWLLTFKEAAHSIALAPAPREMQADPWDKDWFEDPVWRKERLNGIEAHFITAFLDRIVKGDRDKAPFIDGLVPESDTGVWANPPARRYAGYSPGAPTTTLWRGFQPGHAAGMRLEKREAGE